MMTMSALAAAVDRAAATFTGCNWDLSQPGYDYTADDVAASAREAAEAGRRALAFATDGDWDNAICEAHRAFAAENQYGDAPVWGHVLYLVEAMAETHDAD